MWEGSMREALNYVSFTILSSWELGSTYHTNNICMFTWYLQPWGRINFNVIPLLTNIQFVHRYIHYWVWFGTYLLPCRLIIENGSLFSNTLLIKQIIHINIQQENHEIVITEIRPLRFKYKLKCQTLTIKPDLSIEIIRVGWFCRWQLSRLHPGYTETANNFNYLQFNLGILSLYKFSIHIKIKYIIYNAFKSIYIQFLAIGTFHLEHVSN